MLEKPAFRSSAKKRRCLILADGYYEWKAEGKAKKPFYFHLRDDRPFAFAGLWDCWNGEGVPLESCTIITTNANDLSRPIHDRMPVILSPEACTLWLDREVEDTRVLQDLLKPYPADAMESYAANPIVNSVKNNQPECLERVA